MGWNWTAMRVLATLPRVSHVRARKRVIVLKRCLSLVNHNYSNCVLYCNEILLLLIFKPNCPHLHLKKKKNSLAASSSNPIGPVSNVTSSKHYPVERNMLHFYTASNSTQKSRAAKLTVSFHKQPLSQKSKTLKNLVSVWSCRNESEKQHAHKKKE